MSTLLKPRRGKYDLGVLPARAHTGIAKPGHRLVNLKGLGILPGIAGGAKGDGDEHLGTNQAADLVTQTADGVDLNDLWTEFQEVMTEQNRIRQTLVDFLSFPVTNNMDRVAQISSASFEKASEFGVPVGVRPATSYFLLGYDFEWFDIATRYTWKFLADAPASQVQAINAMILEADNRNVFNGVMTALFTNENRMADIDGIQDVNVYSLYNGDGTVPPKYKSREFSGTHSHYLVSGGATVVSNDLDDLYDTVAEHGYSWQNGMQLVVLANSVEIDVIRSFRIANGAKWDFIPAAGSPAIYLPEDVRPLVGGAQIGQNLQGLTVAGAYGPLIIVEEDSIPPKYMAIIATGGKANLNNPVGFREHANAGLRGMRLVKGANPDYPLIDAYYQRGFGTGIRQRGGAAVMQIKASGSYVPPVFND
jgi:hypothetical protein